MLARLTLLSGALAALAALVPASAEAQRVSVSPTVGVYIPTSELVKAAEGQGSGVVLDAAGRLVDPAVLHSAHRTLAQAEAAAAREAQG